jgi:protein TonB
MDMQFSSAMPSAPFATRAYSIRRVGPLALIILLHIGFFYALRGGLSRQTVEIAPKEVTVSFISPEPAANQADAAVS